MIKKKKGASLTALIMIAVMVIGVVMTNGIFLLKAYDVATVGGGDNPMDDYPEDPECNNDHVYHADGNDGRGPSFGTVTVPNGAIFEITTEASINTLNISSGGMVMILDITDESTGDVISEGRLNATTINASDGAFIQFGSNDNVPANIALYNTDGTPFINDASWTTFEWDNTAGIWKVPAPTSKSLVIDLQGYENIDFTVYGGTADSPVELTPDWTFETMKSYSFGLDVSSQYVQVVISGTVNTNKSVFLNYNDSDISSGNYTVSADKKTITYTLTNLDINNSLLVMTAFDNEGDPAIVGDVNNTIFAYAVDVTSETAVEDLLAKELYDRFINPPMYGRFGMNPSNESACITTLKARITKDTADGNSGTQNCQNSDGTNTAVTYQKYIVTWGCDNLGNAITSTIPVYQLTSAAELIIKANSNWYIRNAVNDPVPFYAETDTAEKALIITGTVPNPENVIVGGYGALYSAMNTDGIYSAYIRHLDGFESTVTGAGVQHETILRYVNTSDTYVGICSGDGADNLETGGLGTNGVRYDFIWNTGNDGEEAVVFIGWKTIALHSINSATSVTNRIITNVELLDDSMSDGVSVSAVDDTTHIATVTFLSNFYDRVPLRITYEGGITKDITIVRTGLVIGWQYLNDNFANDFIIQNNVSV